uniref:Uncharacterized protein n=1 Tax=Tanacetum cinerariifolium TaxID=118510 RepID=A0A699WIH0_TANCI|nr:hypothetical protein [Tanacetum cinerariifolium]
MVSHGDMGRLQEAVLSSVFPMSGAGALEEGVPLHTSTLNHLMCMSYTDVAQVANAARNYEILHERDDQDSERPDKR